MSPSTFSLSWEAHKNNICNGLSALQQNNELVDMTLAADGHFVKVHQIVMALASPYFKELITTAEGRHPVIYLNKTSHTTLSAILEYIYTGEVAISIESLSELIQTAKDLHIKGLEDMKLQNSINNTIAQTAESQTPEVVEHEKGVQDNKDKKESSEMDDEICYFEITADRDDTQSQKSYSTVRLEEGIFTDGRKSSRSMNLSDMDENYEEIPLEEEEAEMKPSSCDVSQDPCTGQFTTSLQYTVSNQGSLQMILNRYIYYLKHSNRNNTRQWRCVDYLTKCKCPAIISTRNNVVVQRISAHIHAHHDKRILKKVRLGAIYTALKEAEKEGQQIKNKVQQDKLERRSASTDVL